MKFIIAPDSFKGSLSAMEAADAIADGIVAVYPDAEIDKIPVADGGEGTVDALVQSTNGKLVETTVADPLAREISAKYGILGDGKTVAIEMSAASGMTLLKRSELDPLRTSTFGAGQLIKHALENGYRDFILGLGGSATNDAGTGMAQALGIKFLDSNNSEIMKKMCGGLLGQVAYINIDNIHTAVKESTFRIASDVNNPLLGEQGCAEVYAPQKGASPETVKLLEKNMTNFIDIAENTFGTTVHNLEGAGAAGGFGAGAVLFLSAKVESGIDLILKVCDFNKRIKDAGLIITGEGKIDYQTLQGKTISGVAKVAKENQIPLIAIGGIVADKYKLKELGISEFYSIMNKNISIDYAMNNAYDLLKNKVIEIISSHNW